VRPRPQKSGGAFCVAFPESKLPFVFANLAPKTKDLFTLFHEFGHAFHSAASSHIVNPLLRTPCMDFCEFVSSAFELLAIDHLEIFFPDEKSAAAAKQYQFSNILNFFPFMCAMDEFQHNLYSNDKHSPGELWVQTSRRFRPTLNWAEYSQFEHLGWLARPHIFTSPFYFFEYGTAYLQALELRAKIKGSSTTVEQFLGSLSLGSQRSVGELFEAAGVGAKPQIEALGYLWRELKLTYDQA
jgi:oligoendopeptidase F